MKTIIALTVTLTLTLGLFAEEITQRHMVYFGNSLVANTMPNFHQEFGQSAGRDWTANEIGGAGWPLTAHVFALQRGGMEVLTGDRGDLTFELREEKSYAKRLEEFTSQKYDGMMLQVFGAMKYVTKTHFASPVEFPELWKPDRLEWVPVGDVFMALERKMNAGTFPGGNGIKDFYTDRQHIRIGLPRYTAAATVYAVLFKDHPKALDWNLYAVNEKYLSKAELSGKKPYDTTHDKGALFEMTPENVAAVNETIWEVVTDHPYVKIR